MMAFMSTACYLLLVAPILEATGYSFWDRLRNFLHKFTLIVLDNKLNKLDKFWYIYEQLLISCQVMADMEIFYEDLIIINL